MASTPVTEMPIFWAVIALNIFVLIVLLVTLVYLRISQHASTQHAARHVQRQRQQQQDLEMGTINNDYRNNNSPALEPSSSYHYGPYSNAAVGRNSQDHHQQGPHPESLQGRNAGSFPRPLKLNGSRDSFDSLDLNAPTEDNDNNNCHEIGRAVPMQHQGTRSNRSSFGVEIDDTFENVDLDSSIHDLGTAQAVAMQPVQKVTDINITKPGSTSPQKVEEEKTGDEEEELSDTSATLVEDDPAREPGFYALQEIQLSPLVSPRIPKAPAPADKAQD